MIERVAEERLVVDIPKDYMDILDFIKDNVHIPKKGIVSRALRDYFYKHKSLLNVGSLEEFLEGFLEGK